MQALRRKGVDAQLVVVERQKLHPEADRSLDRPAGFWGRQAVQWPAFLRLLPKTDVFHFYFGWTLVPRKATWPILKATRRKSVLHFLGSDIRGKTPDELRYARGADARIVGSYDALRWVPDAEVIPPGPRPAPVRSAAAGGAHSPDRPARAVQSPPKGHRARGRSVRGPRRRARHRRGAAPRRGTPAVRARRHRRRPAERRLVRDLRARGDGARQAGAELPATRGRPGDRARARRRGADRPRDEEDASRADRGAGGVRSRNGSGSARCPAPTSSVSTTRTKAPIACSRSTARSSGGRRSCG